MSKKNISTNDHAKDEAKKQGIETKNGVFQRPDYGDGFKPRPYFDLNTHVYRLLKDEPFYAALSRHVQKRAVDFIPTAGVMVDKHTGYFELIYNPEFFRQMTDTEIAMVLRHEYDHLIFMHVTERLPEEGMTRMWNFATDAAINSEIFPEKPTAETRFLFDLCVLPEKFEEFGGKKLPRGKSAEWYLNKFRKMMKTCPKCGGEMHDDESDSGEGKGGGGSDNNNDSENNQQNGADGSGNQPGEGSGDNSPTQTCGKCGYSMPKPGESGGGFDSHEGWDESGSIPEEVKDLANQRLNEAMKDAAQEANARGWGNVSANQRKYILDHIQAKVDWRKVLRYFVRTSQRSDKQNTIRRINKRFPYIHAGRKVNRVSKIAVSIDQSGSVSDQMLAAFFAELNKLAEIAEFTVVPFDTRVEESKVFVWKKNQNRQHERVLCGGTDFNAPTKWVNEKGGFDGHIVLTDMYAPKPVASKCQRMWMTDKECAKQPYFSTNEKVVAIDY